MTNSVTTQDKGAHLIVLAHEKENTGTSTVALHIAIGLLRLGYKVATLDTDTGDTTLTGYMINRWQYIEDTRHDIPCPKHIAIETAQDDDIDAHNFEEALKQLTTDHDFIIIDTPVIESAFSRLAHQKAGTLITLTGQALKDLRIFADIKGTEVKGPSAYTEQLAEYNVERLVGDLSPMHWLVIRNRLKSIKESTKEKIDVLIENMSNSYGFQYVDGLEERDIFEALYDQGLTLLDLKDREEPLTMAQIAARQEVRHLICAIGPEKIKGYALAPKKV